MKPPSQNPLCVATEGQQASQPRPGKGATAVQIRLPPPAPVPLAFHATLLPGPGPLQPTAGQGSPALGADTSGILPFPQPRRPDHALDPHDGLSNSGLPVMASMALPSAASASLPRIGSGAPAGVGAGARGNTSSGAARAVATSTPPAEHEGGSSGQQTETETQGASLGELGEDSHPHRPGGSQGRCRSRSMQAAAGAVRKSKFRGVQLERSCNKWRARIHTDKTRHIGYFDDEATAAQAWDLAALKHFGLAWQPKLNFPDLSVRRFQQEPNPAVKPARGSEAPGALSTKLYRGVQHVRRHLVDSKFKAVVQKQRTQIVVGVFDTAEAAARAYDRESLRLNGRGAITNFPLSDYAEELERWQEAYNLVTSCDLGSMPIQQPTPSAQNCATHPLSCGGTADTRATAAGVPEAEASFEGVSAGAAAARGELPAVTSGGRAASALLGYGNRLGSGGRKRKMDADVAVPDPSAFFASPFDRQGSGIGSSGAGVGVVKVGDRWQAYLAVDLGMFDSPEQAAKAHDRASLRVHGFNARLNMQLAEAMAEAKSACAARRLAAAAAAAQQRWESAGSGSGSLKGVLVRDGAFLALLDIDGSQYELGPFPTEIEAGQAYDRYSLLLHGLSAQTNFPPWSYLAPEKEVAALVEAVQTVVRNRCPRAPSVELAGAAPPAAATAQQQQQQQPQQSAAAARQSAWDALLQRQQQQAEAGTAARRQLLGQEGLLPQQPSRTGPPLTQPQQGVDANIWSDHPFRVASELLPPAHYSHPPSSQLAADGLSHQPSRDAFSFGGLPPPPPVHSKQRRQQQLQQHQHQHQHQQPLLGGLAGWLFPDAGDVKPPLGQQQPPAPTPASTAGAVDPRNPFLPGTSTPPFGLQQQDELSLDALCPLNGGWALPPAATMLESLTALAPQEHRQPWGAVESGGPHS